MIYQNSIYIISSLVVILSIVLFAVFVVAQKKKTSRLRSLLLLLFITFVWLVFDLMTSYNFKNDQTSLFIWRIGFVFAFLTSLYSFRFILIFIKGNISRLIEAVFIIIGILFAVFVLSGESVIKSATLLEFAGQSNYKIGDLFFVSSIFITLPVVLSFLFSTFYYFKSKDNKKISFLFLCLGLLAPVVATALANIFPLLGITRFPKFVNFSILIFVFCFFYAIYKWEAFEISFRSYTIRTKISLAFFLVAFLGAFYGVTHYFIVSYNVIENEIINHLQTTATDKANHIETYLDQNIERLKLVTSRNKLRDTLRDYNESPSQDKVDAMKDIIVSARESVDEIERICVIGLNGIVISSTNDKFCGKNVFDQEFFNEGKEKNVIHFVEEDGERKLFVTGPFVLDGKTIGVGITVVRGDYLERIVKNRTGLGETGEVLVAIQEKNQRTYLFKRLFESEAISQKLESERSAEPMKQALLKNEKIFEDTLDYRNEPVLAVSRYIETGNLGLVAKIDKSEAINLVLIKLFQTSLIIFLIVVFSVTFIGYMVARFITKPIIKLQDGVKIIEHGNLNYKVEIDSKDEIGDLSRFFDKMTSAIKKSRAEVDQKVNDQTKEIFSKQKEMENQQKAILNILEDVEEEKENAKSDRDKINAILYSIGDGVFVVNDDLKITIFNKVASEISGYSFEEAMGKRYDKILKFVYEKDKKVNKEFIEEAIRTGEIKEMANHTLLIRKDKTEVSVADSAAPLKNNKGEVIGCVVVFRDVTREREIDRMKTEFVSVASHQLRTPLSAIRWFLEMLLNGDAGKLNDEQKDFVEQAFESNNRMVALVNDLLNVSRIEAGRLAIEPEPTDLIKLSQTILNEHKPNIIEKKQKFEFKKPNKLPKVNIDPKLISQVITNLLSNAIKYTPEKGSVIFNIELKNEDVLFSVKDSGMGIPKDQQGRMFEKFFRADNVVAQETEGTGLGLYVAKSVVESSGGRIWFNSVEGKGTTFWFTIPLSGSQKVKGERSLEKSVL